MPGMPASAPTDDGFGHLEVEWLAGRPGAKWSTTPQGVIAAWVADMDFPAPPPARAALAALATTGDLGYPADDRGLAERWARRMLDRFGWEPAPGRSRTFTDLVQATQVVLHAGTRPGDGVILFTPLYPPFVAAVRDMGRRLLAVPALAGPRGWEFDLEALRAAAPAARAVLLVNPHNPTGRVMGLAELEVVAELAERYDLLVVSDEIHAELMMDDLEHLPFASVSERAAARTVTLYSASKAFNLGGMCCSVAHLGHAGVRRELDRAPSNLFGHVGVAAMATTMAVWTPEGDRWLQRCVARLRSNADELGSWLASARARGIADGYRPEATYLAWLDLRPSLGLDDPSAWLVERARLRLSPGPDFGPGGSGFARLNFATAPNVLGEMLSRLSAALEDRHRA